MQLILKVSSSVLVKLPITVDETKDARMPAAATIGLIITVIVTSSLRGISGGVVIVAPAVSVEFTCTGPDGEFPPTWLLNEKAAESEGDCYTSRLRRAGGLNATATLTINDNHTCNVFNIRCRIYRESKFLYLHNTTLTVQGRLPPPENVTVSSQNSSTQLQWKPPYYTLNNKSDFMYVDPHITHYTVHTIDFQYTRKMIGRPDTKETSFTLSNIQNDYSCPVYQVSAWNAGGESELSEPIQESIPQVPHSIAADNISVTYEPNVVHIHVDVDVTCVSRMPEFFLIILTSSAGRILRELNMTHELGQEDADFTIRLVSLPQNVDICTTVVRISAGNSAGMSSLSEAVEIVCSGGSTEFQTTVASTTVSTTTSTMGTESGNRQQEDSTTLIAITTGVMVAIGGALIGAVIIGIICARKYKNRRGKGHVDNDYSESHSPSLGGPVSLNRPPTAAADLVYDNNEQSTGRSVARDSESTTVWTQSSDTTTTPPSTDSEGSNYYLLQPTPPAPVESPHLVYAQLEAVKLTQVQPPANDDPVQYAQIEHQD